MGLNLDYNYLSPDFYTAASCCWLTIWFQHSLSWFFIMHWFVSLQWPPVIRQWSCQKEPLPKPSLPSLHSFSSWQGQCTFMWNCALHLLSRYHCNFSVVALLKYLLPALHTLSLPLYLVEKQHLSIFSQIGKNWSPKQLHSEWPASRGHGCLWPKAIQLACLTM